MLWSHWAAPKKSHELEPPKRFEVYRSRREAVDGSQHRDLYHARVIVALNLCVASQTVQVRAVVKQIYSVVPEFKPASIASTWSLPASADGDHFVVRGELPAILWHVDEKH